MDAMGIPTATLVGHSMGSSVAQRFAIDCPERTSALVLAGAFASFQDPDLETFVRSSILPLRDPISPSFVREWQSSTIAQEIDPSHFEVVVAETLEVPAFVWHAAFEGFLRTDDFTGELASVAAPTLILWGDRDTYTGRDAQVRLLESLPDARLVTYDGVGHALHWEAPARFARDVAAFVAGSRLGA
jgi:pimeloyl-ACP methyl ester carboxylesterase